MRCTGWLKYFVGTDMIKEELYACLRLEKPLDGEAFPPGYHHYPMQDEEFFKQLTAEQLVTKIVRGYPQTFWEKTRERNEVLDCSVYSRAAAAGVGMDRMRFEHWESLAYSIGVTVGKEEQPAHPVAANPSPSQPAQRVSSTKRKKSSFL